MARLHYCSRSKMILSTVTGPAVHAVIEGLESRTLLSTGVLDPTFGAGGKELTDFPGTAATQFRGQIVVLSATRISRFLPNGAIDPTFGIAGAIELPYAPATFAIRPDDKIVVASYDPSDGNQLILSRYLPDGGIDTSFGGGDGQVTQPFFGGDQTGPKTISKMLIRPDNYRIYVLGNVSPPDNGLYDWALAAYDNNGDPYSEFQPYFTTTSWGYTSTLNDAVLTSDYKIVAVGAFAVSDSHHPDVQEDFAIARYDEHGQLDNSFSGDGKTLVNFGIDRELNSLARSSKI